MISLSSDVYQYADDTVMFYCYSNLPILAKKLQDDIDSVAHWLVSNTLWINMSKTETMLIGSCHCIGHQHVAVNIDGNPLCDVTVATYLGLYTDQHLT